MCCLPCKIEFKNPFRELYNYYFSKKNEEEVKETPLKGICIVNNESFTYSTLSKERHSQSINNVINDIKKANSLNYYLNESVLEKNSYLDKPMRFPIILSSESESSINSESDNNVIIPEQESETEIEVKSVKECESGNESNTSQWDIL